jgi:hypothetical protein
MVWGALLTAYRTGDRTVWTEQAIQGGLVRTFVSHLDRSHRRSVRRPSGAVTRRSHLIRQLAHDLDDDASRIGNSLGSIIGSISGVGKHPLDERKPAARYPPAMAPHRRDPSGQARGVTALLMTPRRRRRGLPPSRLPCHTKAVVKHANRGHIPALIGVVLQRLPGQRMVASPIPRKPPKLIIAYSAFPERLSITSRHKRCRAFRLPCCRRRCR